MTLEQPLAMPDVTFRIPGVAKLANRPLQPYCLCRSMLLLNDEDDRSGIPTSGGVMSSAESHVKIEIKETECQSSAFPSPALVSSKYFRGPLVLLRLDLGLLSWGKVGSPELAIYLLSSLNWEERREEPEFIINRRVFNESVMTILVHVSVGPPDTGKADVECGLIYLYWQLEETLDSFLAPSRPLEDTVKKTYEARIKNLARRFFQLLLRYRRIDRALCLAEKINAKDLFMAKQKYQYDKKHSKGKVFEKGVEVLMKDFRQKKRKGGKLDEKWIGSYIITSKLINFSITIETMCVSAITLTEFISSPVTIAAITITFTEITITFTAITTSISAAVITTLAEITFTTAFIFTDIITSFSTAIITTMASQKSPLQQSHSQKLLCQQSSHQSKKNIITEITTPVIITEIVTKSSAVTF
ncbi:hypothetical protein EMCRGX_G020717 [Ephydatia muelleri]